MGVGEKYLRLRLKRVLLVHPGLRKRRQHGLLVGLRIGQEGLPERRVHQDAADTVGPLVNICAQPS